jgi:hypothetical protein
MHTHTHTLPLSHTHPYTHTHTHKQTHTLPLSLFLTHTHTHTHTNTNTNTCPLHTHTNPETKRSAVVDQEIISPNSRPNFLSYDDSNPGNDRGGESGTKSFFFKVLLHSAWQRCFRSLQALSANDVTDLSTVSDHLGPML